MRLLLLGPYADKLRLEGLANGLLQAGLLGHGSSRGRLALLDRGPRMTGWMGRDV